MKWLSETSREFARRMAHSANNGLTLTGVVVTTASGLSLVWFWLLELSSPHAINPYLGILLFMALPGLFMIGLAMIPLGLWRRRRQQKKAGSLPAEYAPLDLHSPMVRRMIILLGLATAANIAILGTAGFKGIEYMDSNKFCGLTCHTPMTPEYTAFLNSPHSRVGCAQCHIGAGADWFVKSKLSGVHQVFAVAFDTYHRPITSPVESLRPARETCEQCHWPQKFTGEKLIVRTKYAEDETNTATTSVLLLKIGGSTSQGKIGIHGRHLDEAATISYVHTDPKRLDIPKVSYRDRSGQVTEFLAGTAKPADLIGGRERTMDCIDCHNRPTHTFELPERALDKAMLEGTISPSLPFVKKQALTILKADYPDQGTASLEIPKRLEAFYRERYPAVVTGQPVLLKRAAETLKAIYLRNVFPEMKLKWGEHPNLIGHEESLGCFRCHDGGHTTQEGRTIEADCNACHTILAQDEKNPKILKELGLQ